MSLPTLFAGKSAPGLSAALDLRFALDKSLTAYRGPTPSFSRASTGSYFDGSGVLRYAALNQVLYSEDFGNAAWVKQNGTISTDQIIAPDGKTTADKFTENVANTFFNIYNSSAVSHSAGATMTASGYFKYGTRRYIQFILGPAAAGVSVVVDLLNGLITATGSSGAASYTSSSITNAGNGWYRVSVTGTLPSANTGYYDLFTSNTSSFVNPYPTFSSSGEYTYIWGAQVETGSTVGTYCPTTTAANSAPRFNHTFNGTSWVSRGLLVEEQRTNSNINSEDLTNASWSKYQVTISSNATTAPDGTTTADKIVETSANDIHVVYADFVVSSPKTYSVFLKAAERTAATISFDTASTSIYLAYVFDLANGSISKTANTSTATASASIQNVGNGWYRCSVTISSIGNLDSNRGGRISPNTSNNPTIGSYGLETYTGDISKGILAWGVQYEAGAFPTSYIGTTNSSVVRSADVCQITGSDFSGLWNGTEGTVVGDFDRLFVPTGTASALYTARDSSNNNAIYYYIDVSNDVSQVYASGASATFDFGSPVGAGISNKIATAYKANDFAASRNSSTPLTDTSGAVPSGQTLMEIGSTVFANYLNGHIARLRYYPTRLTNAKLQELST